MSRRGRPTPWSEEDLTTLRELAPVGTPTGVIALELHRSKIAVSCKAAKEHISLDSRVESKKKKQARHVEVPDQNLAYAEQ